MEKKLAKSASDYDLSRRRRIIGISFYDLKSQLSDEEGLFIEYITPDGAKFKLINNDATFERVLYQENEIPVEDIFGFWAVATHQSWARYAQHIDDYDRGSTIRRPVEEFVLSCIIRGVKPVAEGYA